MSDPFDTTPGPKLTLVFRLPPDFKLVRSEFDPNGQFPNMIAMGKQQTQRQERRIQSNEEGYDAQGAAWLKWPAGKGQAGLKSWVLACVRLRRLQPDGALLSDQPSLLSGAKHEKDEQTNNAAGILGGILYVPTGSQYAWVQKFCGVEKPSGSPTLRRYFSVAGYKSSKEDARSRDVPVEIKFKAQPEGRPPLDICIQVRTDGKAQPQTANTKQLYEIEKALLELPDWDPSWAADEISNLPSRRTEAFGVTSEPEGTLIQADVFRAYLEAFTREHDLVDFSEFSADPEQPLHREPLSSIYVDLDTTSFEAIDTVESRSADSGSDRPRRRLREAALVPKPIPLTAARGAELHRHLVVLGDPGAGKSTFVKHLAVTSARQEPLREIPVYVKLPDFAIKLGNPSEPAAKLLWQYIQSRFVDEGYQQAIENLEQVIKHGQGLIILDALDEVNNEPARQLVREVVADFARTAYGASKIVVTCRTYSYRNQNWTLPGTPGQEGFQVLELKPLARSRIGEFLRKLYGRLDASEKAKEKEASLLASLSHHNLERLAGNPLELFNMALLHWHQKLPDDQAKLYQQLIELRLFQLYEKRYAKLHQKAPLLQLLEEANNCTQNNFIDSLCSLAFKVHSPERNPKLDQCADISEGELREILEPLHPVPEERADWARRVADEFRQRGGLIREEGRTADNKSIFRFPHRNYQEFLASRHLACQPDSATKAVQLFSHHWCPVVRWVPLVQGYLRHTWPEAIALIAGLADLHKEGKWDAVILCAGMVADLEHGRILQKHTLGPECLQKVQAAVSRLIETGALALSARAQLGTFLGRCGDTRRGIGVHTNTKKMMLPDLVWCGPTGEIEQESKLKPQAFPVGPFSMGGPPECYGSASQPFKCMRITKPFLISKYPVTVAQYQLFVDDKGYEREFADLKKQHRIWTEAGWHWRQRQKITSPRDYAPVFQTPNHPRVGVSWYEAVAYCAWLNHSEIRSHLCLADGSRLPEEALIRLPTDAEWELAARFPDTRFYPWPGTWRSRDPEDANKELSSRCNWSETSIGHTCAVGLFSAGNAACGAADLAGNVWEWCQSQWVDLRDKPSQNNYNAGRKEARELDADKGRKSRVMRGGSWQSSSVIELSNSYRGFVPPYNNYRDVGFRCVMVLGPTDR